MEADENLGIPEAQAALEVIHNFNQDMGKIEANMRTLVDLMEKMAGETEKQQKMCWQMEDKTIQTMERQSKLDQDCEMIIQNLEGHN